MILDDYINENMINGKIFSTLKKTKKGDITTLTENKAIKFAGKHVANFICDDCGAEGHRRIERFLGEPRFLCRKCILTSDKNQIKEKRKKTNIERYGSEFCLQTESSLKKMKATMIERYGVKSTLENKELSKKMKTTMIKRYGVDNPSKSKELLKKKESIILEKYGVKNVMQNQTTIEKMKSSIFEISLKRILESGYTPLFDTKDFIGKSKRKYEWRCNECGNEFEDKMYNTKELPRCLICNPKLAGTSKGEIELFEFCEKSVKATNNYRDELEIDVYIEELKIGFEYNGLYWHSDKFKTDDYHLFKTNHFKEKGIRIYHIFEDEWVNKPEIVKSIINTKLNIYDTVIYGRKTEIREVESKEAKLFQEENHLQGKANSSINIGLYYKDELVSLMTFGKSRFDNLHEYELVRFVNKKNTKIIGGASKCFKYFIRNYNPISIVSYSDERIFDGGLYDVLGFNYKHTTPPQYYYSLNGIRYNRMNFQKKKLKKLFSNYDDNLTEREMMDLNGFDRIYDIGQKVWSWER